MKPILGSLMLALLTLAGPAQAQFNCTTNNGTITITHYVGPGGNVSIPGSINGRPVTAIGDSAFNSDTTVTSVAIPDSVTSIGDSAFYRCFSLTNVTFGNKVRRIETWAFSWCTNLTCVRIPDSVDSIGRSAFNYCTSLASINIPEGVTTIERFLFYNCSCLENITIPDGVVSIGESAFAFCESLTNAVIGNRVASVEQQAFYYCQSLAGLYCAGNAPSAGASVFASAMAATVYYLPGTVGWGANYAGRPTALWSRPNPVILTGASSFGIQTNKFGFIVSWATNIPVVVEASSTLASPVWLPLTTNSLAGGWFYFSDAQWRNYAARFYRVRSR